MSHLENQRLYQQVDLKLQVAKQQLANLWDGDSNQIQLSQSSNQLWVLAADVDTGQDRQNNLLERSFQLDALAQQATIQQLKAKARPQPTVTLGVNNTRSPEQRTENQIRLGVEIPLNLLIVNNTESRLLRPSKSCLNANRAFIDSRIKWILKL